LVQIPALELHRKKENDRLKEFYNIKNYRAKANQNLPFSVSRNSFDGGLKNNPSKQRRRLSGGFHFHRRPSKSGWRRAAAQRTVEKTIGTGTIALVIDKLR
jgi:hypothetical protein